MLSASLPPLRYSTTRLRRVLPCARAMSVRKAGAAKVTVKAATPPRTNSRLVMGMIDVLHELVVAGSDDQVREARGLDEELRIRAGPGAARARVIDERLGRLAR